MEPVTPPAYEGTEEVTFAKDQPQYLPLPARLDSDGVVYTAWLPNEDERVAILRGAPVILSVMTFGQPLQPLQMTVGPVPE